MTTAKHEKTNRIVWVDILRFLGMTLIYAGHLVTSDNTLLYIYAHHVPLFFFISGFFASAEPKEVSFWAFLLKKIRTIVLPYIIFTLINYIFMLITGKLKVSGIGTALLASAAGVRNKVPGPLWFFTCLFIIAIAFELIKRAAALIKNKKIRYIVTLAVPAVLFVIGITCLGHEPTQDPAWIWNADSAMVYIIYYALGAFIFPVLQRWKYKEESAAAKVFFWICFAVSLALGIYTLAAGSGLTNAVQKAVPEPVFEIYALVYALILIFMEVVIARIIALIPGISRALAYAGKDSLYLCGNEMIIKYIMRAFMSAIGLTAVFSNDILIFIYSIICIFISVFTLNLIERLALSRLFK